MHAAPLPFSAPTLDHAPLWRAAVASETPCGNELNFANLILLGPQYHLQIAFHHHFAFRHYSHNPRFNGYGFPLACQNDDELNQALLHVEQDALFHQRPAQFCWLSPTQLAALQRLRPQQYQQQQQAANADYIYQQTDLANLAGAPYRKKRNRIAHSKKLLDAHCSTWNIKPLQAEDACVALKVAQEWAEAQPQSHEAELHRIKQAFELWHELQLTGVILRADGIARGFAIVSQSNDSTANVHVEKCSPDFKHAYPLLVQATAQLYKNVQFINREEDLGITTLTKAKQAWHPALLLHKSSATPLFHVEHNTPLPYATKSNFS